MERCEFYASLWEIFKKCTEKATSHFLCLGSRGGRNQCNSWHNSARQTARCQQGYISEEPSDEAFTVPSLDMTHSGEAFTTLEHEGSQVLLTACIRSPPLCSWVWTGRVWGLSHGGCQRQLLVSQNRFCVWFIHQTSSGAKIIKNYN